MLFISLFLDHFLLSHKVIYSMLISFLSFLKHGISHFPKNLSFLLLKEVIYKPDHLHVQYAPCYCSGIYLGSFKGQRYEKYIYICVNVYIGIYRYILHIIYIHIHVYLCISIPLAIFKCPQIFCHSYHWWINLYPFPLIWTNLTDM